MSGVAALVLLGMLAGATAAHADGLRRSVPPGVAFQQRAQYLTDRARLGLTSPSYALPWAGEGLQSIGSPRVFALLISFSDYPPTITPSQVASQLFGDGTAANYPYDSLRNWYRRSSYGKLDMQGSVLGWYDAGVPRSAVTNFSDIIVKALRSYDRTTDFSQFDNNGDGRIDYFLVFWSGGPNVPGQWWPATSSYWVTNPPALLLDGKTLGVRCGMAVPDGSWVGVRVAVHETGHALGLPDLGDVFRDDDLKGGAGGLDQMDSYGDLNGYFKWVLGWLTPHVCAGAPARYTLAPAGTSPDALVVLPAASASDHFGELFLVQNRLRVGNDAGNRVEVPWGWPADGLLVAHVDGALDPTRTRFAFNNSVGSHKLFRVMEADGLETIGSTGRQADAADLYQPGGVFGPATKPNSDSYYQPARTGVWIGDITGSGASFQLTASAAGAPPLASASAYGFAAGPAADWHNISQVATVTVTGGSGVARTVHYSLDGGATWNALIGFTVPVRVAAEGSHHVLYCASDSQSVEATHDAGYVNVDTLAPVVTGATPVSVKRGQLARFRFQIDDGPDSCGKADVTVRIQKGASPVQTLALGIRATDTPVLYPYRIRLPKGRYTYTVSARDIAGNASIGVGRRLTVR